MPTSTATSFRGSPLPLVIRPADEFQIQLQILGAQLRFWREKVHRWSRREAVRQLNIPFPTIKHTEEGRSSPSYTTLLRFARGLVPGPGSPEAKLREILSGPTR